MRVRNASLTLCALICALPNLHAAHVPDLLAGFDRAEHAIELDVQNQADRACLVSPFEIEAAAKAQLEQPRKARR